MNANIPPYTNLLLCGSFHVFLPTSPLFRFVYVRVLRHVMAGMLLYSAYKNCTDSPHWIEYVHVIHTQIYTDEYFKTKQKSNI